MSECALQFHRVGFAYEPGRWILRGYDGDIRYGESLAILGPNGRGKTTLLKVLLGVLTPTEGRVVATGIVAFVPQLFQVSFDYTALDMVLVGRAKKLSMFAQPTANDRDFALTTLDRFGLADYAQRGFHELSGGQRQLVILARALVSEAQILILDEPTSALDLRNQEVMLGWISRLARRDKLAVVFTTHDPDQALAVADRTMLMLEETTMLLGPTREVVTETSLSVMYGVEVVRLSRDIDGRRLESFVHRRHVAVTEEDERVPNVTD